MWFIFYGISIMSLQLLAGESLLTLYPVLIKGFPTDLWTQTLARLLSASLLTYPWITTVTTHSWISLLYVCHIYASYLGFRNLEVGTAMTLFYLYPLFNVLFNHGLEVVWWPYLISLLGVFLITSTANHLSTHNWVVGLVGIMVASVTESVIYTLYKHSSETNPFNMLFGLSFVGTWVILGIWIVRHFTSTTPISPATPATPATNLHHFLILLVLNGILGVGGYLLRFNSLSVLSTEWYSILSFVGVIMSYVYGWWFFQESITWTKLLGTLLISTGVIGVLSNSSLSHFT